MLNRLKAYLGAPEAKASRTAQVLAFESGRRARWTPRDYAALACEGYLCNAIVHRAVRLIAENVASCGYLVFEGAQERDAHPLAQLLARPNPRQDGIAFCEALVSHLLLAGNAYVEAVALDGAVRELYALRPDRMKAVPGADGWAEAYEYGVGGRSVRFDQAASTIAPILHLTFFHPLDDHYGLAPIEAAAVAVRTDGSAKWIKFIQDGDVFTWDALAVDFTAVINPGTSAILRALSVPAGINVTAIFHARCYTTTPSSAVAAIYTDPAAADTAPDFNNAQQIGNTTLSPFANLRIRTDTARQIRVRSNFSDSGVGFTPVTEGWIDPRGK